MIGVQEVLMSLVCGLGYAMGVMWLHRVLEYIWNR
jgi:hypothetical protein